MDNLRRIIDPYVQTGKKSVHSHIYSNWQIVNTLILTSQQLTASQNMPVFPESHKNVNWWAT